MDERRGVPASAQATVDRVTEEIASGQDQKVYEEAADEWRATVSAEHSRALLGRVRERLGRVRSRALHSGKERDGGAGGAPPGHSLVLTYQTTFERGTGMETFTLLERGDNNWLLAGYLVTSDALQ